MFLNSNVKGVQKAVEWQQKIILKADNLEEENNISLLFES